MKLLALAEFLIFYTKEVVIANFKVAFDVITPSFRMNPQLVSVDIHKDTTDFQIMLLANLVTMTPGTLSVDVSDDKRHLLIHIMYYESKEALEKEVNEAYLRRILNVF